MTYTKKGFFSSIIWVLISLLEYAFLSQLSYSHENLYSFAVLVCANLLAQTYTLYKNGISVVSFYYAFILFLYIFHYGQLITFSFFYDVEFDFLNYIESYVSQPYAMWKALLVSLMVINMVVVGGLVVDKSNSSCSNHVASSLRICKKYSVLLFIVSTPFRLALDIMNFLAASSGGYGATDYVSIGGGIFSAFAGFWYVAVPIYYLCLKSKKDKNVFCIIILIYMAFTMLCGHRGHQFVSLISLFIVYIIDNRIKINICRLFLLFILSFVVLSFLDIIFAIRTYGIDYLLSHMSEVIKDSLEKNVYIETLNDFGGTIFTPYLVIEGYGIYYQPFWGECMIKSFMQVIPDFAGWFKELNTSSIYPKMLNSNHQIGGSFVGDMYYNFGNSYWIFPLLFGYYYSKLSLKTSQAIISKNLYQVCLFLPFLLYSLWWVRDCVGNFTRPVIWLYFLLIFTQKNTKTI